MAKYETVDWKSISVKLQVDMELGSTVSPLCAETRYRSEPQLFMDQKELYRYEWFLKICCEILVRMLMGMS